MKVRLVLICGELPQTELELELPAIVGRGRRATVQVSHPLISRQHCELQVCDGNLIVTDLGSMNGTLVNRQRVLRSTIVRHGDLLTLGSVIFRLEWDDCCATKSDLSDETVPVDAGVTVRDSGVAASLAPMPENPHECRSDVTSTLSAAPASGLAATPPNR